MPSLHILKATFANLHSYDLPHLVHDSCIYPRKSANGSTVIIYGNEEGIRVIWYGGKGFKPSQQQPQKTTNGTGKDAMVIDLDEPETSDQYEVQAEFSAEEEEIDPLMPHENILRYVDVACGSAALKVAVPPIPSDLARYPMESFPKIFEDQIIVAAACADLSIRLIALPLHPPHPEALEIPKAHLHTINIFGPNLHQDLISGIAITHTASPDVAQDGAEQTQSRSRSRNRFSNANQPEDEAERDWYFVLASTSCTGRGLLLVHQIPLMDGKSFICGPENLTPIQRQYLRYPATDVKLTFNTSPYPSERHCNLLITLRDASCVKIYQLFPQTTHNRSRRDSNATADSASSARSLRNSYPRNGKFLISLLPSFTGRNNGGVGDFRKGVIDAKWILAGRAVIALLDDGEWGIWDIEAVGPSTSSNKNLLQNHNNISGIHGGALTRFAIRGNILSGNDTSRKDSKDLQQPAAGNLAPMTPHTRKIRSQGLFQGKSVKSDSNTAFPGHGTIDVSYSSSGKQDDSVVISYGNSSLFISSILSYWRSEIVGRTGFEASIASRAIRIPIHYAPFEEPGNVAMFPLGSQKGLDLTLPTGKLVPNLLITTQTHLLLLVTPLCDITTEETVSSAPLSLPIVGNSNKDQILLKQGELDIDGMDRILEGMRDVSNTKPPNLFGKSVGFQIDDDEAKSTGLAANNSLLRLNKSRSHQRNLFS